MAGMHIVTPPAVEPLTLTTTKLHLRVDTADDDALIAIFISAAREACESFIRGKLITQTWEVELDAFPSDTGPIPIPIEPLISVQSVIWTDWTNTPTTLTAWNGTTGNYIVDTDSEPGRLVLPPNNAWPGASLWPVSPIKIALTAGFGTTEASVPFLYRAGMLMAIAHWYENREAVMSSGAIPKEVPMGTEYAWWLGGRYWHNF